MFIFKKMYKMIPISQKLSLNIIKFSLFEYGLNYILF